MTLLVDRLAADLAALGPTWPLASFTCLAGCSGCVGAGWSTVALGPVVVAVCAGCDRPSKLDQLRLTEPDGRPYARGDTAVFAGELVTITTDPKPDGTVWVAQVAQNAGWRLIVHLAELNAG